MRKRTLGGVVFLAGIGLSVLPPLVATLSFFPLFSGRGSESLLSGLSLLFCILALLPCYKGLRRLLASLSVWGMWLVLFVCVSLFASIAKELCIISLLGFLSNLGGAVLMAIGRRMRREAPDERGE